MNPADRAIRSAFTEAFANYTARADLNEHKADAWDFVIDRGYLTPREIREAREFARLGEPNGNG